MTDRIKALEAENERLRALLENPCSNIFMHKWLNPGCVQSGCQSLVLENKAKDLQQENERLRVALRFYATRGHYVLDAGEEFDTVSGEPPNWQMSGLEGSTTMVEDGHVARMYLRGESVEWVCDGEDITPQPIEGEVGGATRRIG